MHRFSLERPSVKGELPHDREPLLRRPVGDVAGVIFFAEPPDADVLG